MFRSSKKIAQSRRAQRSALTRQRLTRAQPTHQHQFSAGLLGVSRSPNNGPNRDAQRFTQGTQALNAGILRVLGSGLQRHTRLGSSAHAAQAEAQQLSATQKLPPPPPNANQKPPPLPERRLSYMGYQ